MTESERYNGWANYETWNVALWLDNDAGSYEYVREIAAEVLADYSDEGETIRTAKGELADRLREMVEEMAPDLEPSMFSDLLTAAISEVDWYEIAENVLSELKE